MTNHYDLIKNHLSQFRDQIHRKVIYINKSAYLNTTETNKEITADYMRHRTINKTENVKIQCIFVNLGYGSVQIRYVNTLHNLI